MEIPKYTGNLIARAKDVSVAREMFTTAFAYKEEGKNRFVQANSKPFLFIHPEKHEKNSIEPVFSVNHLKVFLKDIESKGFKAVDQPKRIEGIGTIARILGFQGTTLTLMEEELDEE